MAYVIKQVEGKFADAAAQLRELVRAGQWEEARALWIEVMGEEPPVPATKEHETWWVFNADTRVAGGITTLEDWREASRRYPYDDKRKTQFVVRRLRERYGGKWEYWYEY